MATLEQLAARLRFPLGERRAQIVARRLSQFAWEGHELQDLVILRSDLDGFREWLADLSSAEYPAELPVDFLRQLIALIRREVVQHGGVFERQHGDRATAIFSGEPLLPGDELPVEEPWARALSTGAIILRKYARFAQAWHPEAPHRPPALRLGIAGTDRERGIGRIVNVSDEPAAHPPEFFSAGYEYANGTMRCLHSIADGLCDIASDQNGWMNIHKRLNDHSAKKGDALWKGIMGGRQVGTLMIDHTSATSEFLSKLESDFVKEASPMPEFSFFGPSVSAWDPANGTRQVSIVRLDNFITPGYGSPLRESS